LKQTNSKLKLTLNNVHFDNYFLNTRIFKSNFELLIEICSNKSSRTSSPVSSFQFVRRHVYKCRRFSWY